MDILQIIPSCPEGHGEMKKVTISQGDNILGYAWFCVVDDCGEAEDYNDAE